MVNGEWTPPTFIYSLSQKIPSSLKRAPQRHYTCMAQVYLGQPGWQGPTNNSFHKSQGSHSPQFPFPMPLPCCQYKPHPTPPPNSLAPTVHFLLKPPHLPYIFTSLSLSLSLSLQIIIPKFWFSLKFLISRIRFLFLIYFYDFKKAIPSNYCQIN